jgi:hypothetical protein
MQTFQPNNNNHCVAYQSTPVVGNGNAVYSNYQNSPQVQQATAHFHGGTGRISHSHHPPNSVHSPSPYRVFMESKSTNI